MPHPRLWRARCFGPLAGFLLMLGPAPAAAEGLCPQPVDDFDGPELVVDPALVITADEALYSEDGASRLRGAVRLMQGGREFAAEALDFDETSRTVTVRNASRFRNAQLAIRSREARFDLNAESGVFLDTDFVLLARSARGRARELIVTRSGEAALVGSSYTTCAPGPGGWAIEASRIELDPAQGLGTARHARLRFLDVPVLYLPWFQFPIDDRRRSGLLYPTFGESDKTGFDLRWPVYLNLAPNYDATFTPRLMSSRGLQLGNQFRYLLARGQGEAQFDYLDDDQVTGEPRRLTRFHHEGLINRRLALRADFAEVSDPAYYQDLGGSFESASLTHLERSASLTYQAPDTYRLQVLAQTFQPLVSDLASVDEPYKRLPQITLDAETRESRFNTRAGLEAELVNFARDSASVEGQRVNLVPYLRYRLETPALYFTSQADLHYTGYQLTGLAPGATNQPSRTLPVLSAEAGLRFERATADGGLQTLEPRGFALYVPYQDQDRLPLFDTGEPDFDVVQLFARNRYSGEDRISDAQHVAGSLTTRWIDPRTGFARWSASVGQLLRFEKPRVALPGLPTPESGATEFIGEIRYQFSEQLSSVLTGQWSPREDEFDRSNLALRYVDAERRRAFSAAYRYRREVLEQTDLSAAWPLGTQWRVAARSRYSLKERQSLDHFAGVEYATCCWALTASYRRYIADSSGDFNSGVYLQLDLKGLTRIGSGGFTLLPLEDETATALPPS
ncbi:MAG TPA: LPS-assembly protein LptD [Nevskiaceae bacterium]|nr:LPS-assembly protein LptD [Nevskiaceae bacterium]